MAVKSRAIEKIPPNIKRSRLGLYCPNTSRRAAFVGLAEPASPLPEGDSDFARLMRWGSGWPPDQVRWWLAAPRRMSISGYGTDQLTFAGCCPTPHVVSVNEINEPICSAIAARVRRIVL
jgi:hypothetical protein